MHRIEVVDQGNSGGVRSNENPRSGSRKWDVPRKLPANPIRSQQC